MISVGAEYRSFLLYWSPIVLKGILEEQRYLHFLLLSGAITLFLGLSITEDDIRLGEEMLYIYLDLFPGFYGKLAVHFSREKGLGSLNGGEKKKKKKK